MNDFPRVLFLETSTRCNLACPMCARNQPGWLGGEGDLDPALVEGLAPALARAEAVVLNGLGEPLMHPELPRLVALVKASQPAHGWCGLQTNGLLLTPELAEALVCAGLDVACFSVDGEAAALGHGPGQGGAAARGAELLRHAAADQGRALRLGAETVLMRANVLELPQLVDWAAACGLDFLLATHLLPVDPASEAEGLFHPCSGAALEHFARYRERAAARGLDLARVPLAAMRFRPSDEDAELLALAREMHESAHRQGVWLNLGRLAATDFAALDGLRDILAEARRRAERSGLALSLPEVAAPSGPSAPCGFIRRDAAFLDWRGNAAPCHFLWHGHQCRLYGETKRVHPVLFGNVGTTSLLELWNATAWRDFRRHAGAAEFPRCGDCDLGLCSDACGAAGGFEQDCLGAPVPCGHCPWAAGQLLCLGSEP